MIEQKAKYYFSSYATLERLDYWTLSKIYGNSESFITSNKLNFVSQIGCMHLTGNEILHYPELSKALRNIPEYPVYKKSYAVTKQLKELRGLNFLVAFVDYVKACQADFLEVMNKINAKINNLIYLYGAVKTKPLVTSALKNDHNNCVHSLVINGVIFKFSDRYDRINQNPLIGIDLERLIFCKNFDNEYAVFDAALLNTPYIALRVKKTSKHIGRVIWYNLDEMKVMTAAEINLIKKKGVYQEVKNKS